MASAFAKTARLTASGEETMYEMFRILDNFNVQLGAAGLRFPWRRPVVHSIIFSAC
jgi:hypothetical protein